MASYIPHPKLYGDSAPVVPVVATVVGAFLILVQGLVAWGFSSEAGIVYSLAYPGDPVTQGEILVATGFLLTIIAVLAFYAPGGHKIDGALIWVVMLVANVPFALGAGFLVGSLLAFYGGTHLYVWAPPPIGGLAAIRTSAAAKKAAR